jgi:hypothetical protein
MITDIELHDQNFIDTIELFLNDRIDSDEFCNRFVKLWIISRDEHYKIKETWNLPYDQELVLAKIEGRISAAEFSEQYLALWGMEKRREFHNMINSIHSLCMSYSDEPESEWDVDRDALLLEVTLSLQAYQSSQALKTVNE